MISKTMYLSQYVQSCTDTTIMYKAFPDLKYHIFCRRKLVQYNIMKLLTVAYSNSIFAPRKRNKKKRNK